MYCLSQLTSSSLPVSEYCLGDYLKHKGYETHFKSQQEEVHSSTYVGDQTSSYENLEDDPNLENYPKVVENYLKTGRMPYFNGGGLKVTDDKDIEIIIRAYWGGGHFSD
ncbi:MAG: hypothetical protein PQJ58_06410 [Spirochaetales bacterium]|nr:hypothetical protein [Spirochaetales bacterium]